MTAPQPRRRHQRIETPLDILIDGPVVRALDWSISGFAMPINALPDGEVGHVFDLDACFHLGGVIIGTRFRAIVVRRLSDRIGCRFVDPTDEQMGLLRQLHSAHRAGRAPRADSVTATLGGAGPSTARSLVHSDVGTPVPLDPERAPRGDRGGRVAASVAAILGRIAPSWGRHPRAILAYALIGLLGLGLGTYALSLLLRPIEATFAAVMLPGDTLRAPTDGVIEEILARPGDLLSPQSALVRFRPRGGPGDGGARFLPSPCSCSVAGLRVQEGQAVRADDPLITLAPRGGTGTAGPAIIETLVSWTHADLFTPGAAVVVRISGTDGPRAGEVITAPAAASSASALPRVLTEAAEDRLKTVYVSIDGFETPLVNGQPARVRLDRSPLNMAHRLFGG
ncbi:PilZ domain-containing protein [Roseospira visakhapatnamensis]|uniref:PilZ domain-containing protein n=1 Tax=Roseospira visakhapatnamensis TaxID=390880 RepID=A0A7W6RAM0_9PROT|nr:PilZ domain-containing protein [Roseospira visakhapatnamensis]MBB4264885.1 hypothetical protein [Roseospira visakhapatnamensis]